MSDPGIMMMIGMVCALFGFAVGGLVASLRSSKGSSDQPEGGWDEAIKIWRNTHTGEVMPEVGGKRFNSVRELDNRQFNALALAIDEMRRWLAPGKSLPETEPVKEPVQSPPQSTAIVPPPEPYLKPLPVQQPAPGAQAAPKKISLNPIDALARAVSSDVKAPAVEKSIATQVDEILQEMLEVLPPGSALQMRGIRLMELPGRGMVVMVGLEQYEGVGAVPDPEIRTFIQRAVGEWERRALGS